MESTVFIREAKVLIEEIETFAAATLSHEEEVYQGNNIQKMVQQAFAGLQNPTLPSAYRLRDAAHNAGFYIDPKVLHRLAGFENIRG